MISLYTLCIIDIIIDIFIETDISDIGPVWNGQRR